MNKKIMCLAFIVLFVAVMVAPAFAKKMDVPEDGYMAYYSGGEAWVVLDPGVFPYNSYGFYFTFMEGVTSLGSGDALTLFVWIPLSGGYWLPAAFFTTNPDIAAYYEAAWGSTLAASNTIVVPETDLKVDRHGNTITASLTEQVIQRPFMGDLKEYDLPAFTIELTKVGGSIHQDRSSDMPVGTNNLDIMGFEGNGVFNTVGSEYEMQDCLITMHGIQTYVPTPE